ncbi:MAG: class B sortase [Lachnospiraceae bacterium]|nr:class B sortase [Lachnospiraceae bacterium]
MRKSFFNRQKDLHRLIFIIIIACLALGAGFVVKKHLTSVKEEVHNESSEELLYDGTSEAFTNETSEEVAEEYYEEPSDDPVSIEPNEEVIKAMESGDPEKIDAAVLSQYRELNPDTKALIRIDGTVLNHPLMQSESNEGFYLNHDVLKNKNANGTPFMSLTSELLKGGCNAVIYGHNIHTARKDVFEPLAGYESLSYYKDHPTIRIVTDQGASDYLVIAYYLVDTADEDAFVYWEQTSWKEEKDFESYMSEVEKRNWLKTGIPYDIHDSFITLSSCSLELAHSGTNRMVVMARLIRATEKEEVISAYLENAESNPAPFLPQKLRTDGEN